MAAKLIRQQQTHRPRAGDDDIGCFRQSVHSVSQSILIYAAGTLLAAPPATGLQELCIWCTFLGMGETYKPVRALDRGLDLLLALNEHGRARPAELAAAAGLDRTTTYRMLQTLVRRGLVARSPAEDSFFLLRDVQRLSAGYVESDQLLQLAARELGAMLPKVKWPSDFSGFRRGEMVIQETTHRFSAYSVHRAMVGKGRPLLTSAVGRAVLAVATPEEQDMMLDLAERLCGQPRPKNLAALMDDFLTRGYAWSVGAVEAHISAIALPVCRGDQILGAVNIVFFRRASTPEQIAAKHLSHLHACVAAIESGLTNPS
jgi:IclR family mhp operon transcriptional activator